MPFNIVRQDITKFKADAVVNAANTDLQMGGGVCGAIFSAAGATKLQLACEQLAPIQVGEVAVTPGFNLPARYIIHAVGPIYDERNKKQCERALRSAYLNAMRAAVEYQCASIAFPLISSGSYGYPKEEALRVADLAIREFLREHELDVTLVVFDKPSFVISRALYDEVRSYIDEHYIDAHPIQISLAMREFKCEETFRYSHSELTLKYQEYRDAEPSEGLDDVIGSLDEPFSFMLLRLIDDRNMSDVQVYKRANLDRKLFSKIRTSKGYMPSKRTALALAVALELSLDETGHFLERAGYALSSAVKFDVIIKYFISKGRYDIFEINHVLFAYDQQLLGG